MYKSALTNAEITQIYNHIPEPFPTRYFVDADATGNNDGKSWENAFTDIREAFMQSKDGMEIWVADGVYTRTGTSRLVTFGWETDSIKLYGGFNGTETLLSERDWRVNKTILSGNIGDPNSYHDNSYSTFMGPLGNVNKIINHALIDGIIIEEGKADGLQSNYQKHGGGYDAGEYVLNTDFKNCVFRSNFGKRGGAVSIWTSKADKTIDFEDCIFENNSGVLGSVVSARARQSNSLDLNFTNCLFQNNEAKVENSGTDQSSLFYLQSEGGEDINVNIVNSTIANNSNDYSGTEDVAFMLLFKGANGGNQSINIKNTIIWNTGDDVLIKDHSLNGSNHFTSVDVNTSISDLTSTLSFYSPSNVINQDPLFVSSTDLSLPMNSPAVDAGLSTVLLPSVDLAGNPRISGGMVDLGCYEYQSTVGINDFESLEFTAQPNPTSGMVYINTENDIQSIELFNMSGKKIKRITENNSIDMSSFSTGIYLLKVESSKKMGIMKIVKE